MSMNSNAQSSDSNSGRQGHSAKLPNQFNETAIAIIGMSGRFPQAKNLDEYWQNLCNGVECISFFTDEDLAAEGVDASVITDPKYVKAAPIVADIEYFDAAFFGYSPREAKMMDPQHRLFLECAWEALEDAGYDAEMYEGAIGFYAGASINTYVLDRILSDCLRPKLDFESFLETFVGSDKDFLTSRVSYRLNLRGPSVTVQTACSTSLVAVHMACQGLITGDCNMALAGAISVRVPHRAGYYYRGGGIVSPDGHCRAFDAEASGTVFGSGGGIVVLKRLRDALADGDRIHAVICGTAINNDGSVKSSYTAPGVIGQRDAIVDALSKSEVNPETISYIEAHGTGTPMGDPIEIDALTQAFRTQTKKKGFCAIGSVKPNIGHLDVASGMAGLIKAILALKHQQLPPSINFDQPNPRIDFANSPFFVNTQLSPWIANSMPRRAGVTALGLGGTNAHVILEEAPPIQANPNELQSNTDRPYLLPLSARSPEALKCLVQAYQNHLNSVDAVSLSDLCYSASLRRHHHCDRLAVISHSLSELCEHLQTFLREERHPNLIQRSTTIEHSQKPVFIFPGQGSQWLGMGRQLLKQEPVFKARLLQCEDAMRHYVDWSLLEQLTAEEADSRLTEIDVIQPILFAIAVALAALWRSWGVEPAAVVGHSMGEVAAAHVAGALSLEDAARIICRRSQLIKRISGQGAMAVVGLSLEQAGRAIVGYEDRLSIAVSNSPASTVLSGDPAALETVLETLKHHNVFCRWIKVDVASHSPQMDPLQNDLLHLVQGIQPELAEIPIYSTVTGKPSNGLDLDATYWVKNLREPVLFSTVIQTLVAEEHYLFIEMSPHPILQTAIEQGLQFCGAKGVVLPSIRREEDEQTVMLSSLGALYAEGDSIDWRNLYSAGGTFVPLPFYPWQRQRYWLDRKVARPAARQESVPVQSVSSQPAKPAVDLNGLLYDLEWRLKARQSGNGHQPDLRGSWLIFADQTVGTHLAQVLHDRGEACALVFPGATYTAQDGYFTVNPDSPEDLQRLVKATIGRSELPYRKIIHLWSLNCVPATVTVDALQDAEMRLCGGVLHLMQALASCQTGEPPKLWFVTQKAQPVQSLLSASAAVQSLLWGFGRVITLEHPELWGGLIDLDNATPDEITALLDEILASDGEDQVALRAGERYVARLMPVTLPPVSSTFAGCNPDTTYLITGGMGGLGLKLANWLVEKGARHLVLTGRKGLPDRSTWDKLQDDRVKEQIAAIQALEALGATVNVVQADVCDPEQMTSVLATIQQTPFPLRGIVHAAGISIPQSIAEMSLETFRSVLQAKVTGTWVLHQLTETIPLDFFILFSSAAAIWGSSGLAPYAAANHFLDAVAHYRRANHLPALSVNWGSWDEINVVAAEVQSLWARVGLQPMPVAQTLGALELLLQSGTTQKTVASVDWSLFKPTYQVRRHRPLLAEIQTQPVTPKQDDSVANQSEFLARLEQSNGDRTRLLIEHLQATVAEILDFDPESLPETQQGFFQMGMDSLMSIQLKNRLEVSLSVVLPSTLAFDYPTIELLANYLATEVLALNTTEPERLDSSQPTQPATQEKSQSLDDLFAEIESIPDDDVSRLLKR